MSIRTYEVKFKIELPDLDRRMIDVVSNDICEFAMEAITDMKMEYLGFEILPDEDSGDFTPDQEKIV